jgi:hypothetical protein
VRRPIVFLSLSSLPLSLSSSPSLAGRPDSGDGRDSDEAEAEVIKVQKGDASSSPRRD